MYDCFACLCTGCLVPRDQRGPRIPGTGVTEGGEELCECGDLNLDPLEE